MNRARRHFAAYLLAASAICLSLASVTQAYVDLAPTLGKIIKQSATVTLVEVADFNRATHTLTLKPVRASRVRNPAAPSPGPRLDPGNDHAPADCPVGQSRRRGVLFSTSSSALVCFGTGWYQVRFSEGTWRLDEKDRSDLPLAYYGSVSRLSEAVEAIIAGKSTVITAVAHNTDNESGSFDLASTARICPAWRGSADSRRPHDARQRGGGFQPRILHRNRSGR